MHSIVLPPAHFYHLLTRCVIFDEMWTTRTIEVRNSLIFMFPAFTHAWLQAIRNSERFTARVVVMKRSPGHHHFSELPVRGRGKKITASPELAEKGSRSGHIHRLDSSLESRPFDSLT
jgi:hypothetical protein